MRKLRRIVVLFFVLLAALAAAPGVQAHPLGNFTINHYAGLLIQTQGVTVDYVLDMAEIPAFREIQGLDANQNGRPEGDEIRNYPEKQCQGIAENVDLQVNGQSVKLDAVSAAVEFPPGQGGLLTLRLTCGFQTGPIGAQAAARVSFSDQSYAENIGWREIVVAGEGGALSGDFSTRSISQRLTAYPADMLSSPLDQRSVGVQFTPGGASSLSPENPRGSSGAAPTQDRNDAFTRLILMEDLSAANMLLALGIAFVWGALHAFSPGHGKTVVGAYLVGSRGTVLHALYLGLTTTITHTAGVFVFGFATLLAARFILPERIFPWISLLSGLLVLGLGGVLFTSRLRSSWRILRAQQGGHAAENAAAGRHHHLHDHKVHAREPVLLAHGTTARATHVSDEHTHGPGRQHIFIHTHAHDHLHAGSDTIHPPGHSHEHGEHEHGHHGEHSHLPPGADGAPVTWRSLLALGISGGLLPCPSALVVLLSAIALNRVGFGLALVLAFSLGLAGVLTGIGVTFVYASRFINRLPGQGVVTRVMPILSALLISAIGFGIVIRGLQEIR